VDDERRTLEIAMRGGESLVHDVGAAQSARGLCVHTRVVHERGPDIDAQAKRARRSLLNQWSAQR
jgi:hypothetical protein